jgi:hypothetical protein
VFFVLVELVRIVGRDGNERALPPFSMCKKWRWCKVHEWLRNECMDENVSFGPSPKECNSLDTAERVEKTNE